MTDDFGVSAPLIWLYPQFSPLLNSGFNFTVSCQLVNIIEFYSFFGIMAYILHL